MNTSSQGSLKKAAFDQVALLILSAVSAFIFVVAAAIETPGWSTEKTLALASVGAAAVFFTLNFSFAIKKNDRFTILQRWGGFGGSEEGWQMSSALTHFLLMLFSNLAFAAVLLNHYLPDEKTENQASKMSLVMSGGEITNPDE